MGESSPEYDAAFVNRLKNTKYTWHMGEIYHYDGTQSVLLNEFGYFSDCYACGPWSAAIYGVSTLDRSTKLKYSEMSDRTDYEVYGFINDHEKKRYYAFLDNQIHEMPFDENAYIMACNEDTSIISVEEDDQYYKLLFKDGAFSDPIATDEEDANLVCWNERKRYEYGHCYKTDENNEKILMAKVDGKEVEVEKGAYLLYVLYDGSLIYSKDSRVYIWKDGNSQRLKYPVDPEDDSILDGTMISDTEYYYEFSEFAGYDYLLYNIVLHDDGDLYAIIDGKVKLIVENVDFDYVLTN